MSERSTEVYHHILFYLEVSNVCLLILSEKTPPSACHKLFFAAQTITLVTPSG